MLNILQSCKSSAVLQMCTVETTGYNSEAVSYPLCLAFRPCAEVLLSSYKQLLP